MAIIFIYLPTNKKFQLKPCMRIYYVRTIVGTLVRFEVRHGCNILSPFLENFSLIFHVDSLLADDSHEISNISWFLKEATQFKFDNIVC